MSAPEGSSRLVTKLGHLRAAEQPSHPAGHARLWERNGSGETPSGAGRRGDLQPDNLCDQRRCRLAAHSPASALSSGRRGRRFKSTARTITWREGLDSRRAAGPGPALAPICRWRGETTGFALAARCHPPSGSCWRARRQRRAPNHGRYQGQGRRETLSASRPSCLPRCRPLPRQPSAASGGPCTEPAPGPHAGPLRRGARGPGAHPIRCGLSARERRGPHSLRLSAWRTGRGTRSSMTARDGSGWT
jgi:hypothetical protein